MRQIKFRGKRVDNGEYIYGDLKHMTDGCVGINISPYIPCEEVEPDSVAQRIVSDKNYNGIYDGDTIRIDYDAAAKVIGDGLLLRTIQTLKPSNDAKLKIEYSHYRYRLIWKTHNGRVDTGIDMALLETILPFVEVVSDDAN